MLALTTMPGLAEICPTNTPGDTNENCKNKRDIYSSIMKSCAEWIEFNGLDEDIGNCEKDGTRYGHSKATHHKGCCFVFGNDTGSRDPIISLVETYNRNFNMYKTAPEKLINEPITFGTVAQLNNWKNNKQPSITALETGYDALCKKNGGNYEFKRQGKTSTYICQETKNTEQTAQQSTLAPTNTNAQIGNNGNKGSGNSKSNGYTVYVKGVPYDVKATATNTQQKINNIVNVYNNTTSLSPEKEINFSDMYKIFFSDGDRQEPSIIAVNDGYKSMCADLQNTSGIATTHWTNPSTVGTPIQKGKCVIDSCDQNHEKVAGRCQPKNQSVKSTTVVQETPNTEITQTIKEIQSVPATIGQTITYLKSHATNSTVKQEIINWKKKCRQAVAAAQGLSSDESDYIDADYDSETNSLKCRIKKCRDSNARIAPDGKSCIANEDKSQQSRSTTPVNVDNASVQPAVQTPDPTVSVEEDLLESDKSSAKERPEQENIEKLKPDDVALNPVVVNTGDVEIKAPAKTPLTQEDCDKYNMILDNGVCREKSAEEEKKEFSGLVVDENGEPLIGAIIQNISSPSEGTTTGLDGNFSCELTGGDNPKVRISYTGYKTQEVTLEPDPVRVQLVPENQVLDEISVDGKILESMQKCIESGGEWITGNTEKGEKSYCECNEKILDNGVCRERTAEEACDYEGGKWTGTTCDCPEGEEWKVQYEQCVAKSRENECDDQEVEHIIEEMATPKQDSNGNLYIEYSINYKTCDDLQQTWSEKCPDGTKSSITEYGNNIKLTCVPKDDSEVKENNESDFNAIVQAFEERAKQLKDQKCGQQQ